MLDSVLGALAGLVTYWPIWASSLITGMIQWHLEFRVFTKAKESRGKWWKRANDSIMWFGFLLAPLYSILYQDPFEKNWTIGTSLLFYSLTSGVLSLVAWALIRKALKKVGITFRFPGESEPPTFLALRDVKQGERVSTESIYPTNYPPKPPALPTVPDDD